MHISEAKSKSGATVSVRRCETLPVDDLLPDGNGERQIHHGLPRCRPLNRRQLGHDWDNTHCNVMRGPFVFLLPDVFKNVFLRRMEALRAPVILVSRTTQGVQSAARKEVM